MYKDTIVMRCTSCSFEVDYNDFHRDRRLESEFKSYLAIHDSLTSNSGSGTVRISGVDDIEYRARFLVKSHMKTKLSDSPNYGVWFLPQSLRMKLISVI
jgi:hypothetical protein